MGSGGGDAYAVRVLADGSYAWGYSVGGPRGDWASGVAAAPDGSVFVVGGFGGAVDFDPTSGVDEHTAVGKYNMFVTKLGADGTYLWTLTVGGPPWSTETRVGADKIALDPDGNMLITGFCSWPVDFDPGPGMALESCGADVFLTKLSADGSYLWTRRLRSTGSRPMSPGTVGVDTEGNAYVTGMFSGTVDFDPGPAVDQRTAMYPYDDIFITKYHPDGSYAWARTYNAFFPNEVGGNIAVDGDGNALIAGYFYGTVDFDPDPIATDWRISVEGERDDVPDIFVTKLYADGSYAWTYTVGGPSQDMGYGLAVDGAGNAYATGVFEGPLDFDPGPGTDIHDSNVEGSIFLTKLHADGSYAWTHILGTGAWGYGTHVAVNPLGGVVVIGPYWAWPSGQADFDPGCEVRDLHVHWVEAPDTFIVQLACPDLTADLDSDGDTDLLDLARFQNCFTAPDPTDCGPGCSRLDFDADNDIDLIDFTEFEPALTGP
jgi:hypothetical protein